MSDITDTKLQPAQDEVPSNQSKPVAEESESAKGSASADTPAVSLTTFGSIEVCYVADHILQTAASLTEQATGAASAAASTVAAAASGVSDNVFAMFGGGAKKDKKEDEDRGENSGSAKAQKAAAAAENPEVCIVCVSSHDFNMLTVLVFTG